MENQSFQEIGLDKLIPNPLNPRKRFSGTKFDELVTSVREKGVIEPILVRPLNGGFEIVAGERRFRALRQVAEGNGGLKAYRIPAMVRDLTDDDAFDLMCIENLQREDLTELEEAQGFKVYLDKKGEDALPDLAERTGINPRYIRRRLAVLQLPKKVLTAWEKGELKYGHLEQLRRLDDKKDVIKRANEVIEYRGALSVRELKDKIDQTAVNLKDAKFSLEKSGCLSCMKNSETQKDLFDMGDLKGAHCLNPKCFKQTTNNWLQANWKKCGYRKRHGTNGFRFRDDLNWDEYERFYNKPPKRCKDCKSFITIIHLDGSVFQGKACIGDKNCFNKKSKDPDDPGSGNEKKEPRKTPAWHGEYFREEFYKEQLPLRLQEMPIDDEKTARVMLFSLLKSNREIRGWFGTRHEKKPKKENEYYDSPYFGLDELWEILMRLSYNEIMEDLKAAAIEVVMQDQYSAESRRAIADHIGISLQEEWRITKEYLAKKTIPEIKKIAEDFKIFEQQEAMTFLYEVLLKKRGNFNSCKKSELVKIFLESVVDLAGVVPEEILAD